MKKTDLKNDIKKGVLPTICLSALCLGGYLMISDAVSSPNSSNKVEILIGANAYENSLMDELNEAKDDYIYLLNTTCYRSDTNLFLSYFATSLGSIDISILPSSFMEYGVFKNSLSKYAKLTEEIISSCTNITNPSFYSIEGVNYGIEIYSPNEYNVHLSNYIELNDEDYYLFISSSSKHAGELTSASKNGIFAIIDKLYSL